MRATLRDGVCLGLLVIRWILIRFHAVRCCAWRWTVRLTFEGRWAGVVAPLCLLMWWAPPRRPTPVLCAWCVRRALQSLSAGNVGHVCLLLITASAVSDPLSMLHHCFLPPPSLVSVDAECLSCLRCAGLPRRPDEGETSPRHRAGSSRGGERCSAVKAVGLAGPSSEMAAAPGTPAARWGVDALGRFSATTSTAPVLFGDNGLRLTVFLASLCVLLPFHLVDFVVRCLRGFSFFNGWSCHVTLMSGFVWFSETIPSR